MHNVIAGNVLRKCEVLNEYGEWKSKRFENIKKGDHFRYFSTDENVEGIATADIEKLDTDSYNLKFEGQYIK